MLIYNSTRCYIIIVAPNTRSPAAKKYTLEANQQPLSFFSINTSTKIHRYIDSKRVQKYNNLLHYRNFLAACQTAIAEITL